MMSIISMFKKFSIESHKFELVAVVKNHVVYAYFEEGMHSKILVILQSYTIISKIMKNNIKIKFA